MTATTSITPVCPACGNEGRRVQPVTPESLLTVAAKSRLNGDNALRFCKSGTCDVVYFGDGPQDTFGSTDLSVPVFQKSTDPSRLVCYCFEHSVQSIADEVAATGTSSVPDSIAHKCKDGLDRCEELNPQGSCCLGNVRQVVKAGTVGTARTDASAAAAVAATEELPSCCAPQARETSANAAKEAGTTDDGSNMGRWTAGGALVAAVLSSACCWLPLALIGIGTSAAGVAGFFEAYRLYLLGATGLLLGGGFYYVYFRKPTCAPTDACATPNPRLQRWNKIVLWIATVGVVAFAAFPDYVGLVLGGDDEPPPTIRNETSASGTSIGTAQRGPTEDQPRRE